MSVSNVNKYEHANQRTLRLRIRDIPGKFGEVAVAIGAHDVSLGDIALLEAHTHYKVRDVSVFYKDYEHLQQVIVAVEAIKGVRVLEVIDAVFEVHKGGKLEVVPRNPMHSIEDLRRVYTPGVASVCKALEKDPELAYTLTMKGNTIAVVTNGTAVLGLGDIGALAGLPVMEGKAMLLKQFGDVGGFPILIESHDPEVIIETVQRIAPVFGAIQLEDIAAPACFHIEEELERTLDIPVMHDDQHGTATVALGGLMKATDIVDKRHEDLRIVMNGAGAAGIAIANILLEWGIGELMLCDSRGIVTVESSGDNSYKRRVAERCNPEGRTGTLADAMRGADVFIGVSKAGLVSRDMVRSMAKNAILFPMANPVPEIWPEEAIDAGAAVAVDGRTLNNALAFPGLFRGALNARATSINMAMKVAAAEAIAEASRHLTMMPSILDMEVHQSVIRAVYEAAIATGVARVGATRSK